MRKFPRNDPQQNIPALKATNKVTVIVYMKSTRTGKTYVVSVWAEDPGKKQHTHKNSEQLRRYLPGAGKHCRY